MTYPRVRFEGDPGKTAPRLVPGMEPWPKGEVREFTPAFCAQVGRSDPEAFSTFFLGVFNANYRIPPFTLLDPETDASASDDAPKPTKSAGKAKE